VVTDYDLSDPKVREVHEKVEAARSPAEARHVDWRTYIEYVDGSGQADRITDGLPADCQVDLTIINYVKALLDTMVAMLVLSTPPWYVAARDEANEPAAGDLTDWMQQLYYSENLALPQWQCYKDVTRLGNGFLKPYWSTRRNNVALAAVSPIHVYPDPTATDLDDCEFVAIRNRYSKPLAKRLFGEKSINWDRAQPVTDTQNIPPREIMSPHGSPSVEQVEVWEVYDHFGERQTIYTGGQRIVQRDSPIPGGRIPLVHFQMWPDQNHFWSESIVEQTTYPQDQINKLRTRLATWFRFHVNPAMITDDPNLVLNLSPGKRTVINTPDGRADPWVPPPLPADVFAELQALQASLDVLIGIHEVERGIRPKGLTSGISLEVLQEAGRMRQAGPAMFWGNAWGRVGQMLLELMQRHYAEQRTMPVVTGGTTQVLHLDPTVLSAGAGDEPLPYDVVVQAQGRLPRSEVAEAETALTIAQIVPWDLLLPELLDAVNFPDRHKVVQRYQAILTAQTAGQEAAAQAEAEMAQQPQMAQGPQMAPPEEVQGEMAAMGEHEQFMMAIRDQLSAVLDPAIMADAEQAKAMGLTLDEVPGLAMGLDADTGELLRMYLAGEAGY
jgi:hypothetical protein